ncbi:MAG: restriction endonuclease subunit S [Opitutales bacterium]|nr:restriction endonuclease subunit S [Opitutales bacterium]
MNFSDTIPTEWPKASIGKYCEVQLGKMLQNEPTSEKDELKPYLRAINIAKNGLDLSHQFSMWIKPQESERFRLRLGDILVSEGGDAGRTCVFTSNDEYYFQNAINRVRPQRNEVICSEFIYYWFSFLKFSGYVEMVCNVATIAHFTAEKVKAAPLALPPLDTQRRIAAFLDEKTARIDGLIAKKRELLERLAEKRQALITQAVTKGLNPHAPMKPSGIDWIGGIPAHWDLVPFKWRCRVQSGQVDPKEESFALMPLVAPDHIESGTGRLFGVKSAEEQGAISGKYLCPAGAVLYSKIRPALRKVALHEGECLCSADMYAIDPGIYYNRYFLFYFLLTDAFTSYAELESMRVAMPKVNREALGAFPLPLPSLQEQKEIADYCSDVDQADKSSSETVSKSIELLTEYRSALITAAVTGQIEF